MAETNKKPCSEDREINRLADDQETAVGVEIVLKPVQVQVALIVVLIQIRHVQVAIRVAPGRTHKYAKYHPSHHPLNSLWIVSYSGASLPNISRQVYLFFDFNNGALTQIILSGLFRPI